MGKDDTHGGGSRAATRKARLEAELRANLKRRKDLMRARAHQEERPSPGGNRDAPPQGPADD
ncbi:MAG: hypothetical protein AB7E80_16115 [Hyphomicrobiaceae bacterium]